MFFILQCEFFKLLLACHRHHSTTMYGVFHVSSGGETFTSSRRRRRLRCFSDVYKRDSSERRSKQLPGLGRAADSAHISLASALNCLNVSLFVSFCYRILTSSLMFYAVLSCTFRHFFFELDFSLMTFHNFPALFSRSVTMTQISLNTGFTLPPRSKLCFTRCFLKFSSQLLVSLLLGIFFN